MKLKVNLLLAIALSSLCLIPHALADSCGSEDLQSAIDSFAEENSCEVDGSFISAQSLVDNLLEKCLGKGAGKRCRRCLEVSKGDLLGSMKKLARLGAFSSDDVAAAKAALSAAKSDCAEAEPTPTPTATPGEGEGEEGGGGGEEDITQAVLHNIRENCCAKAGDEFRSCRSSVVEYASQHGLSEGAASSIMAATKLQLCQPQ